MRFLGNKASMVNDIYALMAEKGLDNSKYTFFDAFCGSGSVSDYMKAYCRITINDNLNWAVLYSKGRIVAPKCKYKKLGFDPFVHLNEIKKIKKGFIYNNYSQANSQRMYFTEFNAGRIDFFRDEIERWKENELIDDNEYAYLIASLIESVSSVSNTAGVYGAFLKKWDSRAIKEIEFIQAPHNNAKCGELHVFNDKVENIISNVECDILYLDPPYTQNQYGTQYHLLETLVLNDNPSISKVTGSRPTAPMRSDWSKDIKSHILFDEIVAKTKAKYIIFSYNNDGIMSKDYIEAILKRYGKEETYLCKKISYKKYQNWKSNNKKEHFEYLFYIEKKKKDDVIFESPLNYIGSKAKIINEIKKNVSTHEGKFYDLFGGGFNVGINFTQNEVIYNDINYFVKEIIESFKTIDTYTYIRYMKNIIKKFDLQRGVQEGYLDARSYYNNLAKDKKDPRLLFTIILYGFQQQIRFNNNHMFNNPVGVRWFNDCILAKLVSFARQLKSNEIQFYSKSYLEFENGLEKGDYIYMDPPYMLTTGSYNDGRRGFNGWNKELEIELFKFCDRLTEKGVSFMLSYVKEHKGRTNFELENWAKSNNYKIIELGNILGISGSRRKEVLIVNHEQQT